MATSDNGTIFIVESEINKHMMDIIDFSNKVKLQHKDNARELLLNMLEIGRRLNINMKLSM
mgnify:CR=1 FL=1